MTHAQFMAWLVRFGHVTEGKASSQINRVKADQAVTKDSPDVVAAVAEYGLTLAEINLIFKGA